MRVPSPEYRTLHLAAAAALLSCGLSAQSGDAPTAPQEEMYLGWAPSADETRQMFAESEDPVTELLGWPRLRDPGALGGARREVRLWMGFGIGEPDPEIQELIKASAGLNVALDYLPGSIMYDTATRRSRMRMRFSPFFRSAADAEAVLRIPW